VLLRGELGAGKTTLVRAAARALGVAGPITSPTFTVAQRYRGDVEVAHVDAYRLGGLAEVDDLDLDASLDDSVTVVEWGEGKVELLADAHLRVRIVRREDDSRLIELVGAGGDWAARLAAY
jgi:tRNA threonylcarbamoyladenosine biosynthesis protein TsaE